MRRIAMAAMMGLLALGVGDRAFSGETPKPTPPATEPAQAYGQAADDLPLEVFQKFKKHVDALKAAANKAAREEVEKLIQTDAAANKDVLLKALNASQALHREMAAFALRFSGDVKAVLGPFGKTLAEDPDKQVRRAAASSLSHFKDATAVETLIKATADADENVRGAAVEGLDEVKDPRALKPLLDLVAKDDKTGVRMAAASALGSINDKSCVDQLSKLLDDEKDYRVKMAIAAALRKIRGQETEVTKDVPDTQDAGGQIGQLAKDMKDIEEMLKKDRYDKSVRVPEQGVDDRLSKLIEEIEKAQSSSSSSSKQQQQQQSQQQQPGQQPGQPGGKPSSPMASSQPGGSQSPGALNAGIVTGAAQDWSKLPPSAREQMTQSDYNRIPDQWRTKVRDYYTGVGHEESKESLHSQP